MNHITKQMRTRQMSLLKNKFYDPVQVSMMQEQIIVVNDRDVPIRPGSKVECHVNDGSDSILLHRAFSVFMFDFNTKKLLLQKRAKCKITFPEYWANTCCSHPLFVPEEMIEENHVGVKRAAIRKLEQELGVPAQDVPIDSFKYLTTIHYLAPGPGDGWGEHEIDHVLAIQPKNVTLNPNPNEVAEARWFSESELDEFIKSARLPHGPKVSPWFLKLYETFLPKWWANIRANQLEQARDYTIHRL